MSLIANTHTNFLVISNEFHDNSNADNSKEAREGIVNIIVNNIRLNNDTQMPYILEERDGYRKFILPLDKYQNWIKEEGLLNNFSFIKTHGTYKNIETGSWTEYYACSRAGAKQVRKDRVAGGNTNKKRNIQKLSRKIGCQCDLKVHYHSNVFSQEIVVIRYQHEHSGHELGSRSDIQYLRKSEETIAKIKSFAQQGLSLSAIRQLMKAPDEITERYFTSKDIVPNRDELLTYEDIYNIMYKEIHQKYRHDNNDAISILHWVDILKKNREDPNNLNSPILSHFQMCNDEQTFQLGFHTPWQFKLYQNHHEIIHIDSTHNTNVYKYALFTILIRHPYSGRGIPLAWYITESSDSNAIRTWLRKLKEDGWEDPKNVILDNDDAEINAIRSIFPQSNVFLCWWHLKYAWRRWIRKNIEKNDQDNLFYDLEQLLNINDENNINSMIGQFEQKWANTPAKNYFNSYYKIKKEMWIKYFRHEKVRGTNTNNFIESYHKKIKYMYLAARFNRRVDFLVNELAIKILRDYRQETIQYELNIGRMSSYNKICRQFEINSADIDNNSIFRLEDSIFVVKSTQSITDYIVERHNNDFVCNCEFYFKNPVSCKHIYAILRKYNIETLEQYTYLLPNNNQEYNDQQEYNDNNQSNISEELNGSIDQWLEHLKMLHKEANLDNIPLDERKKIINKLKDICAIFMYN